MIEKTSLAPTVQYLGQTISGLAGVINSLSKENDSLNAKYINQKKECTYLEGVLQKSREELAELQRTAEQVTQSSSAQRQLEDTLTELADTRSELERLAVQSTGNREELIAKEEVIAELTEQNEALYMKFSQGENEVLRQHTKNLELQDENKVLSAEVCELTREVNRLMGMVDRESNSLLEVERLSKFLEDMLTDKEFEGIIDIILHESDAVYDPDWSLEKKAYETVRRIKRGEWR